MKITFHQATTNVIKYGSKCFATDALKYIKYMRKIFRRTMSFYLPKENLAMAVISQYQIFGWIVISLHINALHNKFIIFQVILHVVVLTEDDLTVTADVIRWPTKIRPIIEKSVEVTT